MAYRKFAADYLFTGYEMLGRNAVLITDETGRVYDIANEVNISDGIERYNGIITPGFINCHCHLELSHMKDVVPSGSGMVDFLLTVMQQRSAPEQTIQEAIIYQEQYMRQKGIVAVGDICNTIHTVPVKGLSSIYFHNFIEATGIIESSAGERFQQAEEVYRVFEKEFGACSIVPHAPYSVSDRLMKLINDRLPNTILSIHNQESESESELFLKASGDMLRLYRELKIGGTHITTRKSNSFRHFAEQVTNDHSLILVHNVHTSLDDVQWAEANREHLPSLSWCFCPNANLYINGVLPDFSMFDKAGVKMVVGTDSIASNTQLNILEEIKTIQNNFPETDTEKLLRWATINGAEALQISNRYGSFEKGKQPGVVLIDGGTNTLLQGTVSRRIL
jgi:cytosine/adenosine deaminase-related metal-dependent hydrolase